MRSYIFVLNCGSSSIRGTLFDAATITCCLQLHAQQLTTKNASFFDGTTEKALPYANHTTALGKLVEHLYHTIDSTSLLAVGHRLVHGGRKFQKPVRLTPAIAKELRTLIPLAPLHLPPQLDAIAQLQHDIPHLPHVLCFDTAFHTTIPKRAHTYPLPHHLIGDLQIQKYGFHGLSHASLLHHYAKSTKRSVTELSLLTLHLGQGCSICAIEKGQSVDTTMGFTPLEGLVMGTRCGSIDPSIPLLLCDTHAIAPADMLQILNQESGLFALTHEKDMQTLVQRSEQGDQDAQGAIDLFCYRAAQQCAAMRVALSRCDAILFTGGIGENAPTIRQRIIDYLPFSPLPPIAVLPAQEEQSIAHYVKDFL